MIISVLGVDLGKNVCSVVGLDGTGAVVLRRRAKRETLVALAAKLAPCIVAMEACCGAHHLGRVFAAHGHDVRLMSPEYVRPYIKAQKNDDLDAEGIAEAATRPTMRFVELKSQDQLDMQALHRSRDRLVGERTALINQLRAILLERGIIAPQGKGKLHQFLMALMDQHGGPGLSPRMISLVVDARLQWVELDRRITAFDAEFVRWTKENEDARRLTTIPGIGPTIATAFIAAVGRRVSNAVAICRLGWASCRVSSRRAEGRSFSASASAETNIFENSSFTAPALRCPMWPSATPRLVDGPKHCLAAPIQTSPWSRSPTSWQGLSGPFCGAEKNSPTRIGEWRRRVLADQRHRALTDQ